MLVGIQSMQWVDIFYGAYIMKDANYRNAQNKTKPVWVKPSMCWRSFSLVLFFPLIAASSFFTGKLPGFNQHLFLSWDKSPCSHCLCLKFPGKLCWLVICDTILRTFSVRPSRSPESMILITVCYKERLEADIHLLAWIYPPPEVDWWTFEIEICLTPSRPGEK